MLDLDHFNLVNDRHGHVGGESVLKQFGQIMVRTAPRPTCLRGTGGEEFSALGRIPRPPQRQRLAERVRKSTEAIPSWRDGHAGNGGAEGNGGESATSEARALSVDRLSGISHVPDQRPVVEPHDLIQAADLALYRCKKMGRDRTHVDDRSLSSLH